MHFDRDDIDLPGFHKFFKESAEEEMEHAQKANSNVYFSVITSDLSFTEDTLHQIDYLVFC